MSGKEDQGMGDDFSTARAPATPDEKAAVTAAKVEPECTTGTLDCLICLLDAQQRIVGANRAQGSEDPGSLAALDRDLHGWLHPHRAVQLCPLAAAIAECWAVLQREASYEAQLRDVLFDRLLHLSAWRVLAPGFSTIAVEDAAAVVVIANVTGLQLTPQTRHTLDSELKVRLLRHTDALAHANEELQSELVCHQAECWRLRNDERVPGGR